MAFYVELNIDLSNLSDTLLLDILIYAIVIHFFFIHTHWINDVQPVLIKECSFFCRDCKIDIINPNSTVLIDNEFYDQFCSLISVVVFPVSCLFANLKSKKVRFIFTPQTHNAILERVIAK